MSIKQVGLQYHIILPISLIFFMWFIIKVSCCELKEDLVSYSNHTIVLPQKDELS